MWSQPPAERLRGGGRDCAGSPSSRCCPAAAPRRAWRRPGARPSASPGRRPAGRRGSGTPRPAAPSRAARSAERQPVPLRLPGAERRRPVGLGEAVEVGHAEPHRFHGRDDRRTAAPRRRSRPPPRASGRIFALSGAWISAVRTTGAPQRCVTPWRRDQPEDQRRVDLAQAHVRAADRGHRPRVGPAVAVEHRAASRGTPSAGRARWPARCRARSGTRRGARTRRPSGCRWCPRCRGGRWPATRRRARPLGSAGIALLEQRLVVGLAEPRAAAPGRQGIVDVDDGDRPAAGGRARRDRVGELAVGDQELGARVLRG